MPRSRRIAAGVALVAGAAVVAGSMAGCSAPASDPQSRATPSDGTVRTLAPLHARPAGSASVPTRTLGLTAAQLAGRSLSDVLPVAARRAIALHRLLEVPAGEYRIGATIVLPAGTAIRFARGARVTGSLPGAPLITVGSNSTVLGGTLRNESTDPGFAVALRPGAARVRIAGTTFSGGASNAVYLDQPGIRSVTVESSRFEGVLYGILLNPGALDANGITIRKNVFVDVSADAVELNGATGGRAQRVRDVDVLDNRMQGGQGSGDSSGFAIGLAGVHGFQVRGNRITGVRNEAVHLEDGSAEGTVVGNTVSGGGSGWRAAVAVYRDTSSITVVQNSIAAFHGPGVAVMWDAQGSARSISILGNRIRDVAGNGIVVAGDAGTGPFTVRGNSVVDAGGDGVVVAGSHALSTITGNRFSGVVGKDIAETLRGRGRTRLSGNTH